LRVDGKLGEDLPISPKNHGAVRYLAGVEIKELTTA